MKNDTAIQNLIDRAFAITGPELCRLMRTNCVTMRDLKKRTGFTLKTIRDRRERGLRGHSAIDWTEAITGTLTPRMKAALRSHYRNDGFRD